MAIQREYEVGWRFIAGKIARMEEGHPVSWHESDTLICLAAIAERLEAIVEALEQLKEAKC